MSQPLIVTLRLLHIVSGAVWVGAVVLTAFFLMPAIVASGPAGGQVMREFGNRKYSQIVMSLMGITVLSGVGLMWVISAEFTGAWFSSPMGRTISLGAALTIVASVFGFAVSRPTATRMQQLAAEMQGSGGPSSAEQAAQMKALQSRMLLSARVVAVLLLVAVASMATARYM